MTVPSRFLPRLAPVRFLRRGGADSGADRSVHGEFDLADGGALVVGGRALVHAVVDLTHAADLQDEAAALWKQAWVLE